jgi:multidrug resistance efflux pump
LAPAIGAAQTSAMTLADFYWRTGHYQSAAFYAQVKKVDDKKVTPKEPVKQGASLEQHIAEALKNNPDIRVAEMKVRETEAELSRTRMKVTSDITTLSAEIQVAQEGVREAEVRYERMKALANEKAISLEELGYAKHTAAKMKAELTVKQAKMPYLLGKQDGGTPVIAEALKNNPDIRTAEVKVREMEAELSRTRMKVVSELSLLHAEIQAAQAGVDEAKSRYERGIILHQKGAISAEDLGIVKQTLQKVTAELDIKRAKVPYLLGRQTGGSATSALIDDLIRMKFDVKKIEEPSDEVFLRRLYLDLRGRLPTAEEMKNFLKIPKKDRREKWVDQLRRDEFARIHKGPVNASCIRCHENPWLGIGAPDDPNHRIWVDKYWQFFFKPESPTTDKLRKALDATIRVDFDNMPLKDVLEYLRDKGQGDFNFHVRGKTRGETPVTVKLKTPVPIGAVLQFLEDEHDIIFVLRDYGIVVVAADERIPPGAMRVIDFWKHGKNATPPPELKDKAKPGLIPPGESPPKDSIRGEIEKVDPKDPLLVQISIGSDAGVAKGQTLEVYRLQPAPQYLGRVQIVEITPTRSIGRALSTNPTGMRPGDQVASNLTEK